MTVIRGFSSKRSYISIVMMLLTAVLLSGCGDDVSPEDRIREMLSAAETAAESAPLWIFRALLLMGTRMRRAV